MSCPNCDHTMQQIDVSKYFWCPRCGTLKPEDGFAETPKLVLRCRDFEHFVNEDLSVAWHRLGIEESINPPGNRKESKP